MLQALLSVRCLSSSASPFRHRELLQTNNPRKIRLLEELGLNVAGRIPCIVAPGEHSENYLEVKGRRMDHMDIGSSVDIEPVDEQTF